MDGSEFNNPEFTSRLIEQPARRAIADHYSNNRGSATCGMARSRCQTEDGSEHL